ncbi:MAG: methyltransferase domain-containing protein [bacterium]|nr:methyltransferase domain-containing protein [bacterium]
MCPAVPLDEELDYLAAVSRDTTDARAAAVRFLDSTSDTVLVLGAGPGNEALSIKQQCPLALLVGLDLRLDLLCTHGNDLVRATCSDAMALPFQNKSFDGVFAERLFQHVTSIEAVLSEVERVASPGSRFVALDMDTDSIAVGGGSDAVNRVVSLLPRLIAQPDAGRQTVSALSSRGFDDLEVEVTGLGFPDLHQFVRRFKLSSSIAELVRRQLVRAELAAQALKDLRGMDECGSFFASALSYRISAQIPSRT